MSDENVSPYFKRGDNFNVFNINPYLEACHQEALLTRKIMLLGQ